MVYNLAGIILHPLQGYKYFEKTKYLFTALHESTTSGVHGTRGTYWHLLWLALARARGDGSLLCLLSCSVDIADCNGSLIPTKTV
jgi:hypothetical protein